MHLPDAIDTAVQQLVARGMSTDAAEAKRALFARCQNTLERSVATTAAAPRHFESHWLFVPGRLEFLGKHTDYAGGRSLICAVDRGICGVFRPRHDERLRVIDAARAAQDPDAAVDLALGEQRSGGPPQASDGHWSNYLATVVRRTAANFPGKFRGLDLVLADDLPRAAGMSSSSALMIAVFLALDHVNALSERAEYRRSIQSALDLAGYLATIENGQSFGSLSGEPGAGTFGGSEDHTAILCSRPGILAQYGFRPTVRERELEWPADWTLLVATSGVAAEKTGAARDRYNRASRLVARLIELWREHTGGTQDTLAEILRSAPDAVYHLTELTWKLPNAGESAALRDRLDQFVEESEQLVPSAAAAIGRLDAVALAAIVARSQQLADRLLKNQVAETIDLVRCANESGALAASAFGAGFGGSAWAIAPVAAANSVLSSWRTAYLRRHPQMTSAAQFFITHPGAAAQVG